MNTATGKDIWHAPSGRPGVTEQPGREGRAKIPLLASHPARSVPYDTAMGTVVRHFPVHRGSCGQDLEQSSSGEPTVRPPRGMEGAHSMVKAWATH